MQIFGCCFARIVPAIAVAGALFIASAADVKPDKKKSQAALQRGKKADDAGKRDEAIAAYTEAVQADPANLDALRARARDYSAAADTKKALADLDQVVELDAGSADGYFARGGL